MIIHTTKFVECFSLTLGFSPAQPPRKNRFNAFMRKKPLKRLACRPASHTRLKPCVNKTSKPMIRLPSLNIRGLGLSSALGTSALQLARFNVLIHSKEIIWIVFLFDLNQPLVIIAVRLFHAFFAFITHQKVYIRSAGGVGMNRIVVTLRP